MRDITLFHNYLAQDKGLRLGTVDRHCRNTNLLLRNCPDFTKIQLTAFILSLVNLGRKPKYLSSLICSIRVYSAFLKSRGDPFEEECLHYPFPRGRWDQSYKSILTDDEIERIITCSREKNETKAMHETISDFLKVMAYSGARPGEIAKLKFEDINWGMGVFVILAENSKTHTERFVPIAPPTEEVFKRRGKDKSPKDLIFTNTAGNQVQDVDWWYHFDKRIARVGCKRKGVSIYSLRHSFITRILEENQNNLFTTQRIVGHSDIRTTSNYFRYTTKSLHRTLRQLPILKDRIEPIEILRQIKEYVNALNLDQRFNLTINDSGSSLMIEVNIK